MKHLENNIQIEATPEEVFAFADNQLNFSSHMNTSSWMLGGGSMETDIDSLNGQAVGSHIKMYGKAFGFKLFLDEVITLHEPPYRKEWQTVGELKILVIGHYKLGFEITPDEKGVNFRVYIDYEKPSRFIEQMLYIVLSGVYANWCVNQMIDGVKKHFQS